MPDPDTARAYLTALSQDLRHPDRHLQLHQLGRTLENWFDPILAWHTTHATAGPPTEGQNNLIKATKRVGFGLKQLQALPHPRPTQRRRRQLGPTAQTN